MLCVYLNPHFTLHHRQHYRFQSPHSSWCPKQEAVRSPRSFRDHPWLPNTALHLRDPHLSRPRPALPLSRLLSYLCHYRVPGHSIAQKADTDGRRLQTGRWNIFKGGRQWHTVPCAAKLLIQGCKKQFSNGWLSVHEVIYAWSHTQLQNCYMYLKLLAIHMVKCQVTNFCCI